MVVSYRMICNKIFMSNFETCQLHLQHVLFTDWFSIGNVKAQINNLYDLFCNECSLCPAFMFDNPIQIGYEPADLTCTPPPGTAEGGFIFFV